MLNIIIEGYRFVHSHRQNRMGGGVGIYLDLNMQYRSCDDISFEDPLIEWLFIEICHPEGKTLLLELYIDHQINGLMNLSKILRLL
jgi:hypothetical protein